MVFSVGVLTRLGPGTVGQQTSTLTARPFNAVIYAKDSSSLTSWREEIRSMSAVVGQFLKLPLMVLIDFFEGFLICSINKRHSNLNIFKALRLSLVS